MEDIIFQYAQRYIEAKQQLESAKANADLRKEELQQAMLAANIKEYDYCDSHITLTTRSNVKLDPAIIYKLKEFGYGNYLTESVDETSFKKAFKGSTVMQEQFSGYVTQSDTYVLSVKEKKNEIK